MFCVHDKGVWLKQWLHEWMNAHWMSSVLSISSALRVSHPPALLLYFSSLPQTLVLSLTICFNHWLPLSFPPLPLLVEQFLVQVTHVPCKSRLSTGPARLHLQNKCFSLVTGLPPKVMGVWQIPHLRKFGVIDGKFCFEGGSQCAKGLFSRASSSSSWRRWR